MTDWPSVPLAKLVTQHVPDLVTPEDDDIVRFAGVRWYGEGLFVREERQGSAVKAKCYALKPGLLLYNRLFAWKQSFAVVTDEFDGVVVSNEFPQFEVDTTQAIPEFLALYCSSPVFASKALSLSSGSAAVSRNRLKEADFLRLEVACPPLEIQERILEVISAVDAAIDALLAETEAAEAARTALLDELLRRRDETWTDMLIGKLGTVTRGKRFIKSDYVDGGIGCIHYSQIHTDFGAVTDEVHSWLPEQMRPKLRFAKPGSLVIAGTSENFDGVLKAVAWLGDDDVAVHDDAYIYEHELEPRFASYVFASPDFRAQLPAVMSNTKVVRVSKDALERLTVPVPLRETQKDIADTMDAIDRQVQATSDEVARAQTTRAALLDALLAHKIEVTPSDVPD
ncbi:restriction endonuclease subunit S [Microbacterium sp. AR7-10]|uniref:restriction endonuclease subunit S n=1 Tax=Microbacterium sp. AR7-10 TaxID=1891970 RepID=UPI000B0CE8A6|nr:restriction endonuclease subunit S [Microbacterium sp. AR7-10]